MKERLQLDEESFIDSDGYKAAEEIRTFFTSILDSKTTDLQRKENLKKEKEKKAEKQNSE